jgi:hypothetical protein
MHAGGGCVLGCILVNGEAEAHHVHAASCAVLCCWMSHCRLPASPDAVCLSVLVGFAVVAMNGPPSAGMCRRSRVVCYEQLCHQKIRPPPTTGDHDHTDNCINSCYTVSKSPHVTTTSTAAVVHSLIVCCHWGWVQTHMFSFAAAAAAAATCCCAIAASFVLLHVVSALQHS